MLKQLVVYLVDHYPMPKNKDVKITIFAYIVETKATPMSPALLQQLGTLEPK